MMTFLKTVLTLLSVSCICQSVTIFRGSEEEPKVKKVKKPTEFMCMELDDCMFYMDLKHTGIPGFTDERFEAIFNKTVEKNECGLREKSEGDPFKVNCPVEDEDLGERGEVFDVAQTKKDKCTGSLEITHANPDDVSDFEKIQLVGKILFPKLYKGFPKLRQNIVLKIESQGTCCWTIHAKNGFKGQSMDITGEDTYDFKPKSAQIVDCPSMDDDYDY